MAVQPAIGRRPGMFATMSGIGDRRRACLAIALTAALGLAACGGGGQRQDAAEPSGSFDVEIVTASFPREQTMAQDARLRIGVRNAGRVTLPNLAVTVDSFTRARERTDLADPKRPVWIVDQPPRGSVTAFTDTWALGPLRPGRTRTFEWRVTAAQPGTYTLEYRIAAGLDGKARAQLPDGQAPEGAFTVRISDAPVPSRVGDDGEVVRG